MRQTTWLALLVFSLVQTSNTAAAQTASPPVQGKIRVLLTYGGHGFEEKPFFAMFDALPGVVTTKAKMPDEADRLKPGLERDFDVLVLYDQAQGFTPGQRKAFVALLDRGIGVVSLHHNIGAHGHGAWPEFRKIIGGAYLWKATEIDGRQYGPSVFAEGQDMRVKVVDRQNPITAGVEDFQIHDETYGRFYTAPGVKVLLTTDHPKNDPPVAWTTQYGKSRVFYFQLGHDAKAWNNPSYPRILANGIRWASGK